MLRNLFTQRKSFKNVCNLQVIGIWYLILVSTFITNLNTSLTVVIYFSVLRDGCVTIFSGHISGKLSHLGPFCNKSLTQYLHILKFQDQLDCIALEYASILKIPFHYFF